MSTNIGLSVSVFKSLVIHIEYMHTRYQDVLRNAYRNLSTSLFMERTSAGPHIAKID